MSGAFSHIDALFERVIMLCCSAALALTLKEKEMSMKMNVILAGVTGTVLIFGTLVSYAAKWDKNGYVDSQIESGFYNVDSIKVKGKVVSWTEKYILTGAGATFINSEMSKHEACKENVAKYGEVTQYQLDYEIKANEYRGVAKRYYNKENKLICTNKDTGKNFSSEWIKIIPRSPIQGAKYDLVTKYKVVFPY